MTHKLVRLFALAVVPVMALNGAGAADVPGPKRPPRDLVSLRHCELDYKRSSHVSAYNMQGGPMPIGECLVELGEKVTAGQVLGRLANGHMKAQLAHRRAEAESDVQVRVAVAQRAELTQKLKRIDNLRRMGTTYASVEEYTTVWTELETAKLQVEQAQHQRELAKIVIQEVEALMKHGEFTAPHDGVVVEIRKRLGETVTNGEPVFDIIDPLRLRVTGHLNLNGYSRVRPGQRVEVTAESEGLEPEVRQHKLNGKVVFVDKRIDPLSHTCRVIAEVENPDEVLSSGLEARMEIFATEPEATHTAPPAATPAPAPAVEKAAKAVPPTSGPKGPSAPNDLRTSQ